MKGSVEGVLDLELLHAYLIAPSWKRLLRCCVRLRLVALRGEWPVLARADGTGKGRLCGLRVLREREHWLVLAGLRKPHVVRQVAYLLYLLVRRHVLLGSLRLCDC